MVGVSLEESTISESSIDTSTAPTTHTGHSTFDSSRDFLPNLQDPIHSERTRKERSSSTLTKDLSLLLRSNSRLKCDSHTGSQTVLHPLPEEYKEHSDYAHNLSQNSSNLTKSDLELRMLRQRDTDKVKRSENKFYGFLRRGRLASRSAPKKRRSRSVDEINQMDQAIQSTLSLANDTHSVRDHGSRFPPPFIKHGPISPLSRPLSTSTVTSNKQLPQLPPSTTIPTPRPAMNPAHVTSDPDQQKPRKKTFFGMITLPTSRRSSVSKSHPTSPRSPTPDNTFSSLHQRDLDPPAPSLPKYHDLTPIPLNDATNYRWDGDVPGQRSQPSFEISEPDSGLGIETIVAKTKLVTIVSPRPHSNSAHDAHIRPSSTPPRVGNGVNRSKRVSIEEPDRPRQPDPTPSGRISPLTAFANPKVLGGRKGKEREGDPDRAKDPRKNTPVPTSENEKGRDSRNSKRNTTNISGPMKINGRTKHGSFDFERPLSASVHPVRTARLSTSGPYRVSTESQRNATPRGNGHLWNAPNPSTYPIQEERSTLTRSQSVRESDLERTQPKIRFTDETKDPRSRSRNQHDPRSRTQQQPNHSSPPQKSAPQLPYRPEGGSWGRRTSPRPGLGGAAHPNGLPSFGTSVTSLQLGGNATRPPPRSDSPQILTLPTDRYGEKWKNRSLDLGLELNWAPSRVKGEAVMDFREVGVRPRWREEAEAKEFDRWKVLEPFGSVLGESDYAKFIEYVQRFDSRLMSLDGQSGLIHKVKRLLDTSAKNLGAERKRELLEVLERVLQHS